MLDFQILFTVFPQILHAFIRFKYCLKKSRLSLGEIYFLLFEMHLHLDFCYHHGTNCIYVFFQHSILILVFCNFKLLIQVQRAINNSRNVKLIEKSFIKIMTGLHLHATIKYQIHYFKDIKKLSQTQNSAVINLNSHHMLTHQQHIMQQIFYQAVQLSRNIRCRYISFRIMI